MTRFNGIRNFAEQSYSPFTIATPHGIFKTKEGWCNGSAVVQSQLSGDYAIGRCGFYYVEKVKQSQIMQKFSSGATMTKINPLVISFR
jgi:hypothetical protein